MRTRALTLGLSLLCTAAGARAQDGTGRVEFERTGYRITALGAKVAVSARLLDGRRRAVPNAPIAYRTSDPTIATVSNGGLVQSKKVGRTKVWAVSGTDSASALIVVDQWATTFAFSPSPVLFDAIGSRTALNVQLRDAAGHVIPDLGRRTTQCRVREERIATLSPTGQIISKAAGITWVRCADRGISDSVRVEVRQRAARVMILDKLAIGPKPVTDTFRLHARAFDSKGDSIAGARATWVSLSRGVASIDPASGFVRALGGGETQIIVQVGDATDTVAVHVTGDAAVGVGVDTSANAIRQPTLALDPMYPVVGETLKVSFVAKDAAGVAIPNAERDMAFVSSNDSIFRYVGNLKIVPRSTGSAYLIARLSVAGVVIAESTTVSPRAKSTITASNTSNTQQKAFVRPKFDTEGMAKFNQKQIADQMKSIIDSGIGRPKSGRVFGLEGIAALAQHSTKKGAIPESRSGLVYGGVGTLSPMRWLVATGSFRTGNLKPPSGDLLTEDMKLTEADAQLALWPASWFGIGGGYMLRGEKAPPITSSGSGAAGFWSAVTTSVMSRGKFVGGAVNTYAAATLFPLANYTGRADSPEITSMSGEAGLELRLGGVTAGFIYYVERFSFAPAPATPTSPALAERNDRFSTLRFKLGFKLGQ